MIKKILHIVVWLGIIAWFIVVMSFVSKANENLLCKEIIITISDSSTVNFVTEKMLRYEITGSGMNIQGYPLEEIETRDLEFLLEENPYVKDAEVYVNVDGDMLIDIDQRKPLIRVMPGGKRGYYIDDEGVILPLSTNFSPLVLLVSGTIEIKEVKDDAGVRRVDIMNSSELTELLDFARFIKENAFWDHQIVQLYRERNGDYEIIPRVGAHQILFGKLDDFETKLRNLRLLYDQGLTKYGWNTYNEINLKYSNQIICTKR